MRIGVLTFSNALNLGAALQAFSLQKTLEQMGHDTDLIDYQCPAIDAMHKLLPVLKAGLTVKARIYNLIYNLVFFPRRLNYKRFQRGLKKSKKYSRETISASNGVYDVFITGSDQVFNLKLTGNDSSYYLDFVQSGKKVSYAASLGVYLPERKQDYQNYLKSFDHLSVRENASAQLFQQEMGIAAEVVPDPVFLHTSEEWKALLGIREKKREKYILVYSLVEDKGLYEIANKIAKEKGYQIYVITKALRPMGKADKYLRNAGPYEFVELMAGAEYVVTNSFHGTAFSLIFKKQFTVLLPQTVPDRIENLLRAVNLLERAISTVKDIPGSGINYAEIEDLIDRMKETGIDYLENAIANTQPGRGVVL